MIQIHQELVRLIPPKLWKDNLNAGNPRRALWRVHSHMLAFQEAHHVFLQRLAQGDHPEI
jgi:hypothetical protein